MSNIKFGDSFDCIKQDIEEIILKNMSKVCKLVEERAKQELSPIESNIINEMFCDVFIKDNYIVGVIGNKSEEAIKVHQGTGIYKTDENKIKKLYNNQKNFSEMGYGYNKKQPFLENAKISTITQIPGILGEGLK
ncbi:hypothetical protein UMC2_14381 [[Clostridium] sordellii]|uniref:hypothetical protein n=1 Tax=Paraclostridium sordellii TaxID=1505 RepID=UPI00054415A9|nr:hypothetical protein [Paeniclostridium sordellii]CEK34188.1 hypothetical protein UMC2_14381 [[Clostridium] sordellii] [Paeniclostridium sordellii]